MTFFFAMLRVVRSCSPTAGNIPGASALARNRRLPARLVGGLVLLLLPALVQAQGVRVEWAPVGSLTEVGARAEVSEYLVERETPAGWERVATVQHSVADPRYQPATGTFVFEDRQGDLVRRYRVRSVDPVGNASAPAEVQPAPAPCTWQTVPVACLACACEDVTQVLDEARGELVRHGLVDADGFAAAVRTLAGIALVAPELLVVEGRRVRGLFGEDREGRRLLYLTPDLAAALHELVHVYERARGRAWTAPEDHPGWERDPRLQEIDQRWQERRVRRPR